MARKGRDNEAQAQRRAEELERLLEVGRGWDLGPVLASGGALIFGAGSLQECGVQIAAAVMACINCGKRRVIAIGPLAPLSPELAQARARVESGGAAVREAAWGIHGADFPAGSQWRNAASLAPFTQLWERPRWKKGPLLSPELILCYPFLANGAPQILPGMARLRELAADSAVVAAMTPFRAKGRKEPLAVASRRIAEGMEILSAGGYADYQRHAAQNGSEDCDVAQVLRYLVGPWEARIKDIVVVGPAEEGWRADALIALTPLADRPPEE